MALSKGVNTYVDLTAANTYFNSRIDVDAWASASDAQKEQALVTATNLLDNLPWIGVVSDLAQSLAFPRIGEYFDPKAGTMLDLSHTIVTNRIENATNEMAYHLLNNDGLLDDTSSVTTIAVGTINLNGIKQPSKLPATVKNFIKPLLKRGTSNTWWRAN